MGTIGVILLVAFIIVCVLLVLLVIVQDDGESGMGGLLGGRGTAAFGSHSASVLTKTTTVLVILFFVLALGLALINKKPKIQKDIGGVATTETVVEESVSSAGDWWVEDNSSEADAFVVESEDIEEPSEILGDDSDSEDDEELDLDSEDDSDLNEDSADAE